MSPFQHQILKISDPSLSNLWWVKYSPLLLKQNLWLSTSKQFFVKYFRNDWTHRIAHLSPQQCKKSTKRFICNTFWFPKCVWWSNHNFLLSVLEFHGLTDEIIHLINVINNLYSGDQISIITNNFITPPISIK